MERKQISVKKDTFDRLSKLGTVTDTFDSILNRLMDNEK